MKSKKIFKIIVLTASGCLFAVFFGVFFFSMFFPKEINPKLPTASVVIPAGQSSSHALEPLISNQWYSNIFVSFPSQPLYALPLAFRVNENGLGISYPNIHKSENTIVAPYTEDFTIGYEHALHKPKVDAVGDWSIHMTMETETNETMSFVLAHGMPFSVIHTNGKEVLVTFRDNFSVYPQNTASEQDKATTDSLAIQIRNNWYIFVFPQSIQIQKQSNELILKNPGKLFIGLLNKRNNFLEFKKIANIEILGTQMSFSINNNTLRTVYQLNTNGIFPLIALYPHQADTLINKQNVLGTYETIRGTLQLVKTNAFSTQVSLLIPPGTFAKLFGDYPDLTKQIQADVYEILHEKIPDSKDYYLGTWFGKITNLLLLADSYGLEKEKNALLQYSEPIFLKSLDNFFYDKEKTSFIAKYPEFGNEKLNDHHFHYGYYIRTAAVLSSLDLPFLGKIKNKIQNMIDDIATLQRDSMDYPFLRNFDIYESHSWADGFADFDDGTNQESSSEAINAWYGLYLWSKVIQDQNLQNYALYLYNSEILGATYYWFDNNNTIYTQPYGHAIASIIWGDKVDFATWFSDKTNMKYGIQLLPFTPASLYLGKFQDFKKYNKDYLDNAGDATESWGDLFVMWKSFYAPQDMLKINDQIKNFETDNPKSLFLYTLYANAESSPTPTP